MKENPTNHLYGEQEGYTLVELAVALLVTLVLGGVLLSTYLAITRWIAPWQREVTLENHVHLIAQRLIADLVQAEQMLNEEEGVWTLTLRDGRRVSYRHNEGRLTRNEKPMHPAELQVVTLNLAPSQAETAFALRPWEATTGSGQQALRVRISLVVASREREAVLETSTSLRQHRPWRPLL